MQTEQSRIIKETVHETLIVLGFTPHDPQEMQADIAYLRRSRKGAEKVADTIKYGTLTIGISGALWSLWEGVKIAVRGQ